MMNIKTLSMVASSNDIEEILSLQKKIRISIHLPESYRCSEEKESLQQ